MPTSYQKLSSPHETLPLSKANGNHHGKKGFKTYCQNILSSPTKPSLHFISYEKNLRSKENGTFSVISKADSIPEILPKAFL